MNAPLNTVCVYEWTSGVEQVKVKHGDESDMAARREWASRDGRWGWGEVATGAMVG